MIQQGRRRSRGNSLLVNHSAHSSVQRRGAVTFLPGDLQQGNNEEGLLIPASNIELPAVTTTRSSEDNNIDINDDTVDALSASY